MAVDIELRWTTLSGLTVTDHAVSANDPDEWPPNYPMFSRTIYIDAAHAATYACPEGWYEHIAENGTIVSLGHTIPVWVYKKMP